MNSEYDLQTVQLKVIRRQILSILQIAGFIGVNERTIALALQNQGINLLPNELRQHLDYLEQRKVLEIIDRDKPVWAAKITADGIDILEGVVKTPDWLAKH